MRATAMAALVILFVAPWATAGNVLFWYDDFDDGEGSWEHVDLTEGDVPRFHLDAYLAYDDPDAVDDVSWWCGTFDYDEDGGYGNRWDQRLVLPPVSLGTTAVEEATWGSIKAGFLEDGAEADSSRASRTAWPVLTFAYRHETEPGYDFVWVDVLDGDVWQHLNQGYDGSSGGWQDLGAAGYDLRGFGDPVRARFRFVSDGAWSDEDGVYESVGGAFHVDNIRIYDHLTGEVYFFEDCQSEPLCVASVPEPAGDWWHIVERRCPGLADWDRHAWWCGDDADTGRIPPGLKNALTSPTVDTGWVISCTLHLLVNAQVPTTDVGDHFTYEISPDGGGTWYQIAGWYGDFGNCFEWGMDGWWGYDVTHLVGHPHYGTVTFRLTMYTNDDGCGPGAAGGAGVFLDAIWLEGEVYPRSRDESGDAWLSSLRRRMWGRTAPLRPAGRHGRR